MKKKRIIPVLLLKNGWLVQSREFKRYQNLGNPTTAVKRLSQWASDELIYLDISSDELYDLRREDLRYPNRHVLSEIIQDVSRQAFMPITVGGHIRTLKDIELRLSWGADKIAMNTQALSDPHFISVAAREFGSQCIALSIDFKRLDSRYVVVSNGGKVLTGYEPAHWAKVSEDKGAGEVLLNSVDRDGMGSGYELEIIRRVADAVKIPVIACGGAGRWEHFAEVFETTGADAVAAANIFHYTDQSVYLARKYLFERGCMVRAPMLLM
jgi:imidazole glycerol-phosphate synthase subunit HisF